MIHTYKLNSQTSQEFLRKTTEGTFLRNATSSLTFKPGSHYKELYSKYLKAYCLRIKKVLQNIVILARGILDLCHLQVQAMPFIELHETERKLTYLDSKSSWAAILRHFVSPASCSSFPLSPYITGRFPMATSSCFYPEAYPLARVSL